MLGGPSLRLGIQQERLSIPSGIGWGGKDTGRLVTWEFPLRIDSASWKCLESFMQLVSFCNSCIRPESSKIVSWSSTNLRLAIVSKAELWNFFTSFMSFRLLWWASRNSEFCFDNCAWRSCWSRRWSSSAWAQWSSSCWDSIISLNFVYTSSVKSCLEFAFLDFRQTLGEEFALSVGPTEFYSVRFQRSAPDHLPQQVTLFSPQRVSPVVRTRTTTDRLTSLLAGSDRQVLGTRYEASPRARCRRNPHPPRTVARRTVAGSGTLWGTRHKSPRGEEVGFVSRVHLLFGGVRSVTTPLKVVEEVQEGLQEIEDEWGEEEVGWNGELKVEERRPLRAWMTWETRATHDVVCKSWRPEPDYWTFRTWDRACDIHVLRFMCAVWKVLCMGLGGHVVIAVVRLVARFHHADAIPSVEFFPSGYCSPIVHL